MFLVVAARQERQEVVDAVEVDAKVQRLVYEQVLVVVHRRLHAGAFDAEVLHDGLHREEDEQRQDDGLGQLAADFARAAPLAPPPLLLDRLVRVDAVVRLRAQPEVSIRVRKLERCRHVEVRVHRLRRRPLLERAATSAGILLRCRRCIQRGLSARQPRRSAARPADAWMPRPRKWAGPLLVLLVAGNARTDRRGRRDRWT